MKSQNLPPGSESRYVSVYIALENYNTKYLREWHIYNVRFPTW